MATGRPRRGVFARSKNWLTSKYDEKVSARGVIQAGDGFVAPKDKHHIENAGGCGTPGKGGAQWSGKLAKCQLLRLGKGRNGSLQRLAVPASILQLRRQFSQYTTGYIVKMSGGLLVRGDRAGRQ
mgnify:CR=1 FL=1